MTITEARLLGMIVALIIVALVEAVVILITIYDD